MSFLKDFFKRSRTEYAPNKKEIPEIVKTDVDPEIQWYNNLANLGEGAFGSIFKAENKRTKLYAALKRIEWESEDEMYDSMIEISILNTCKHPNILNILDAYIFSGKIWLYLEYCSFGALDSIMNTLEKPLDENEIKFVCREITRALCFLHSKFIIHRDLKAGNILINENHEIKMSDFGVSVKMKNEHSRRDSFVGTPYWMSPEIIDCESNKENPYDTMTDIWSYGITLIELAQMRPPHQEMNASRVLMRIRKADPPKLSNPSHWSSQFNSFLSNCLQRNPSDRKTACELLEHDFIVSVTDQDRKFIKILTAQLSADIEETIENINSEELNSLSDVILSPQMLAYKNKIEKALESPTRFSRKNLENKPYSENVEPSDYGSDVSNEVAPLDSSNFIINAKNRQLCTSIKTDNSASLYQLKKSRSRCELNNIEHTKQHRYKTINEDEFGRAVSYDNSFKQGLRRSNTTNLGKRIVEIMKRGISRHAYDSHVLSINENRSRSTENLMNIAPALPNRSNRKVPSIVSSPIHRDSLEKAYKNTQKRNFVLTRQTNQGLTFTYQCEEAQRISTPKLINHTNRRFQLIKTETKINNRLNTIATPIHIRRNKFKESTNQKHNVKERVAEMLADSIIDQVITSEMNQPSVMSCVLDVIKSIPTVSSPNQNQDFSTYNLKNDSKTKNVLGQPIQDEVNSSTPQTKNKFSRQSTIRRTRTRRFVVDGVQMETKSSQLILRNDSENTEVNLNNNLELIDNNAKCSLVYVEPRFISHISLLRDLATKELRIQHKMERRIERDLQIRSKRQMDELENKIRQEVLNLQKTCDNKLEQLVKDRKLEIDQEKANYENVIKRNRKSFKGTVNSINDSPRKDSRFFLDIDESSSRKGSIFADFLHTSNPPNSLKMASSEMFEIEKGHQKSLQNIEQKYFLKKQEIIKENSLAKLKMEEEHISMRHKLALCRLQDYFILNRIMLVKRQEASSQELNSACESWRERTEAEIMSEKKIFQRNARNCIKRLHTENLKTLRSQIPPLSHAQIREQIELCDAKTQEKLAQDHLDLDRRHQMLRLKRDMEINNQRTELAETQTEKLRALLEQERSQVNNFEMSFLADLQAFRDLVPRNQEMLREGLEKERRTQGYGAEINT